MGSERELASLFTVLLFGVVWPAGCGDGGYDGGVCYSPHRRYVAAAALASALEDDALSKDECIALCGDSLPRPPEPPSSEPTSSGGDTCDPTGTGTGGSTTSGPGGGTTTDDGSSTGASTGASPSSSGGDTNASSTGASTGDASTSGTGGDTDASTGTCSEVGGPDPVEEKPTRLGQPL